MSYSLLKKYRVPLDFFSTLSCAAAAVHAAPFDTTTRSLGVWGKFEGANSEEEHTEVSVERGVVHARRTFISPYARHSSQKSIEIVVRSFLP